MNSETSKRLDNIDILRALGILIMLAGHVGFGGKFDRYIHTFHMPIFFFISGYLYVPKKDKSVWAIIGKRAKRLLIPYVTYAAINYVFWLFIERGPTDTFYDPLIRLVTYNTEKLPICGALWFLTAMFFAEALYILIDRIISIDWIRSVVVLVIAVSMSYVQGMLPFRLPLAIDSAIVCMGLYELGRMYHEGRFKLEKLVPKTWMLIPVGGLLAAVNLILAFVNGYVNIKSAWYGYVPLFWINAIIGSMAFYLFAVWGARVTLATNKFRKFLITIGRGSLVFLGLNQLVIMLLSMLYGRLGLPMNMLISGIVILITAILCLYILSVMLKKAGSKALNIFFGL